MAFGMKEICGVEVDRAEELFLSLFGEGGKKNEKELWRKVDKYVKWLRFFPFVRMVAVGNTLAFGRVDEESDIDLFIVARRGRIFFVRTLVTAFFHVLGLRRHGNKVAGRFCLSFFVSGDGLDLSEIKLGDEDVYLFFWVRKLKPVFGADVYWDFLKANNWVGSFDESENLKKLIAWPGWIKFVQRFLENVLNLLVCWWLEGVLKVWQVGRAERKRRRMGCGEKAVVVNDRMLKFHDKDARKKIFEEFVEAI